MVQVKVYRTTISVYSTLSCSIIPALSIVFVQLFFDMDQFNRIVSTCIFFLFFKHINMQEATVIKMTLRWT